MNLAVTPGEGAKKKRAPLSEKEKIQALLKHVEKSGLIFVRNGTEHPAPKAREHMEYKLSRAGNRVQTARQFIDMIATKSYLSGEYYYVKYPDGKMVRTCDFLNRKLAQLEK